MECKEKDRLDIVMVQKGIAASREKAKALINSGGVLVNDVVAAKPGQQIEYDADIKVTAQELKYVSRGGFKLEKALESFKIALNDRVCLDIGASTGGFTDCMLQNGAKKVFAVDVGTEQLAEKLKNDKRVVSREKLNIRYCGYSDFNEKIDFVSIDVSFISLTKILEAVKRITDGGRNGEEQPAEVVCLVKPQFEAGRENIGKHGIVKNPKVHKEVLKRVIAYAKETGFSVMGLDSSPIKGGDGNIEYLLWLSGDKELVGRDPDIDAVIKKAHK